MSEQMNPSPEVSLAGAGRLCKRAWWAFLIGGIASVAFGVMAFTNPAVALLVLAMFFAAFILIDGAANIWGALQNRDQEGWVAVLLLGAAGVLVGGYALAVPPVSMVALIYVIALFAMVNGIMSLYLGWQIRKEITTEWILYLSGALSVLFSLLVFFRPGIGGVAIIYMIAAWAVVIGLLRIWFAFFIRKAGDAMKSGQQGSTFTGDKQ
jgi:uncharacterized membrane protein HdeD (DUF308 family)